MLPCPREELSSKSSVIINLGDDGRYRELLYIGGIRGWDKVLGR